MEQLCSMYHVCDIKFGSITNLSDARYAAAIYAKWVGFCLQKGHPRYIEPGKAKEIIDWLSGPEMVAEVGSMLPDDAHEGLQVLGIQWVQIADAGLVSDWKKKGYQVIVEGDDASEAEWSLSTSYHADAQHIVDITGYSLEDLEDLVQLKPKAINITGGDETVPGMRDFAEVEDMLEIFALEEE